MATPTMVVRIAANLDELKRNLAEGKNQIETTTAAMQKMARSFDGSAIKQQANAMVAAIGGVEGVTKLTRAEQERLNRVIGEAIQKYDALGEQAPADIRKVYEATSQTATATVNATNKATSAAGGLMAKLGPLGPMIATTFSVGAVLAFGKELLATADATVKMADKTGMSIEAVQRLSFVAEQSGNTLEQVSGAVSMLQKRLAEGDDSAVSALRQLGIEHQRFMAMSPDQQFLEVARAVKGIEDPMQRAKVATELFGRAGTELLPTLIANVDELAAKAPVMSERATKAFDSIGDSISRVASKLKVLVGEGLASAMDAYGRLAQGVGQVLSGQFAKAADTLLDLETEMPRVATQAKGLAVASTGVALSMKEADAVGKELTATFRENRTSTNASESAAKRAGEAFQKLKADIYDIEKVGAGATLEVYKFGRVLDEAGDTAEVVKGLDDLAKKLYEIEKIGAGASLEVYKFGQVIDEAGESAKVAADKQKDADAKVAKAAKTWATLGDVFGEVSRAAEMAGHKTTAAVMSIGSAIAKAAPGGPWAMALAGGMAIFATLSDKLFKTQGRQVNDLRDAYISAAGGLNALAIKAQAAGMTLNALLRAKTVKDYEAAIASLNVALAKTAALQGELAGLQATLAQRQVMDWERAQQLIEQYGGTLGNLGQAFTDAKTAANWKTIWDDWQTLIDMGADVGGVLVSMKDEISALVQESIRVGTEIPEQFRPLIEELIRTGQLLGENGEAITDLGQLKFGAPLVSEVDKIIAKIDELIQALTTGLVGAFESVGRVRIPPVKIPYAFEATNELPTGGSVPSYAGGSGGFVNFGAGTLAMLHGYEAVVPRGQAGPGGSSAPVIITVISQLDGKEVARNQVRYLPNQLALAGV